MLPEVAALRHSRSIVRLPECQDVPITNRVRRIIDTAPMQRLATISQLGVVGMVYPGARHHRLEHSLGVYYLAAQLLSRFSDEPRLNDTRQAESFLLAALVHDVGHWPFCHPIEDLDLQGLGEHEDRAASWLCESDLAECIENDWSCNINDVTDLLKGKRAAATNDFATQFFASCLSGPIDVDKLDYLQRDSLHAGVPYGRNFDVGRLIHAMEIHPERPELAISEKGRTAAEMMVFARYVMFSEVYWHHTVRAATAMLQRAVFLLQNRIDLESSFRLDDAAWIATIRRMAEGSTAEDLVEGLFGPRRVLHKRVAEFDTLDGDDLHMRLARRPAWWLVACAEQLAARLSTKFNVPVHAADVLIDAPPVKLEVDINMDVIRRDGSVRSLGELSPVASALARQQFDHHVKRVRVFIRPDLRDQLHQHWKSPDVLADLLDQAVQDVEREIV